MTRRQDVSKMPFSRRGFLVLAGAAGAGLVLGLPKGEPLAQDTSAQMPFDETAEETEARGLRIGTGFDRRIEDLYDVFLIIRRPRWQTSDIC